MNPSQEQLRRALLENYLKQQQLNSAHASGIPNHVSNMQHPVAPSPAPSVRRMQQAPPQAPVHVPPAPKPEPVAPPKQELVLIEEENVSLEQFKEYVRQWIELDNFIKVNAESLRQKKKVRDKLAMVISKFMCKYNIEDLNTKEGKIRCKVRAVKPLVTQNDVKAKIEELFANDTKKKQEIIEKIYKEERPKVEKVSLRRLKITST